MRIQECFNQIRKDQRGSAVVTAVFLAAVLLVIGLGLSRLISQELRFKRDIIEAGKAYFSAEAATESALLEIDRQAPGYEASDVKKEEPNLNYSYSIVAQDNYVPCFSFNPRSFVKKELTVDRQWRVLGVDESVTLPLYKYDDETKGIKNITEFLVAFYIDQYMAGDQTQLPAELLKNADVLRWKIIANNGSFQTVALSDYLPIVDKNGDAHNSANDPSIFGSGGDAQFITTAAKYYEKGVDGKMIFYANESIQDFLLQPDLSRPYLVLTNVAKKFEGAEGSREIYFRMKPVDEAANLKEKFVCEYAKVQADGYSGGFKQSLNTEIKLDSFLPVFDFALYRTEE